MVRSGRSVLACVLVIGPLSACVLAAQDPRVANPERPTVATHAYAVAPGYVETEQGLSTHGVRGLNETTSWDVNVKIGLARFAQLGLFGPMYMRTGAGHGAGDLGVALKLRTAVSRLVAVAIVPTVTVPTGRERLGLGAGRMLGQVVGVLSVDGPLGVHADVNVGPVALGAGRPQWLTTMALGHGVGAGLSLAGEIFRFSAGAEGVSQAGALGAMLVTPAKWIVVDVGGILALDAESPSALFIGLTTNLGHL